MSEAKLNSVSKIRAWPALGAAVILGLVHSAVAQICPTWTLENTLPRSSHALAYDTAREVTVLFGGRGAEGLLRNDTWEWNGQHWTRRAEAGPPASTNAQMVFDEQRGVCVLLVNSQTWTWDGERWTQLAAAGPTPERSGFRLAYEATTGRTIMFGGSVWQSGDWVYPNDTWAWNGTTWAQVATSGPAGRRLPGMAFDMQRNCVVLHGGKVSTATDVPGFANDTWEWDGAGWQQQAVAGPRPRWGAAMSYCSARRSVVLHGGELDGYDSATWEYDGAAWNLLSIAGPVSRAFHALVDDRSRQTLVCFGGHDGNATLGDTMEFTTVGGQPQWSIGAAGGAPAPRANAAMVYDRERDVHVLFGGGIPPPFNETWFGDTWEWDGAEWRLAAETGPSPRIRAAMAYDELRNVMVLFGGSGAPEHLGDTWEWNGREWSLRATTGPTPRYGAKMIYHVQMRACLLFGGIDATDGSSELWMWNGSTWTLLSDGPINTHYEHGMAYDRDRAVVVVHGGSAGLTWEWSESGGWEERSGIGSAYQRTFNTLVYDEESRAVYSLFGFISQSPPGPGSTNDVWRWDPSAGQWAPVDTVNSIVERSRHAATYDPVRQRVLVFGGNQSYDNVLGDTWTTTFESIPIVSAPAGLHLVPLNGRLELTAITAGAEPLSRQWRWNNVPLADGGPISGSATNTLVIEPLAFAHSGVYHMVVNNDCGTAAGPQSIVLVMRAGDVDLNGQINIDDLLLIVANWGRCPATPPCVGDVAPLGGNGIVDIDDLLMVVANWSP